MHTTEVLVQWTQNGIWVIEAKAQSRPENRNRDGMTQKDLCHQSESESKMLQVTQTLNSTLR